jgi:hypothetical protein
MNPKKIKNGSMSTSRLAVVFSPAWGRRGRATNTVSDSGQKKEQDKMERTLLALGGGVFSTLQEMLSAMLFESTSQ